MHRINVIKSKMRIHAVKAKMAEMNVPMSAYKDVRHLLNTHPDLSLKAYEMTTERFMVVLESELSFFAEGA